MSRKKAKIKELEKSDDDQVLEIHKLNESITTLKFANVQLQEDLLDYFKKSSAQN